MILKAIREAIEETVGKLTEKTECVKYIESIKVFLGPPPLEEPDRNCRIGREDTRIVE
jgi:hypothetical protein